MSRNDERLAEFEDRVEALRRRRAELDGEAERWRRERDKLNESVRALRAEALKHRDARDRANRRVAEIKSRIESLQNELSERREKLAEIDAELMKVRKRLPPRRDVEERLKRIDWEMMTTPTAEIIGREETLVKEARELRRALAEHEELDAREDKRIMTLADIKAKELEINECRDEIDRLHGASEVDHERMILHHRKADEEHGRANNAHAKFLEQLSAVRGIDEELKEVLVGIGRLRGRLRESERLAAAERERETEERKKEMLRDARRKLDAGEKLSLDELKLIYGEEEEES